MKLNRAVEPTVNVYIYFLTSNSDCNQRLFKFQSAILYKGYKGILSIIDYFIRIDFALQTKHNAMQVVITFDRYNYENMAFLFHTYYPLEKYHLLFECNVD